MHEGKISTIAQKLTKLGSKVCRILSNTKNCPRLLQFCQRGRISPNLVTLLLYNSLVVGMEFAPVCRDPNWRMRCNKMQRLRRRQMATFDGENIVAILSWDIFSRMVMRQTTFKVKIIFAVNHIQWSSYTSKTFIAQMLSSKHQFETSLHLIGRKLK